MGTNENCGSYGSFLYTAGPINIQVPLKNSVYPSGLDWATNAAPMVVPAPGLFSTTTDWPNRVDMRAATNLAPVSSPPPGAMPTMRRIGRLGKLLSAALSEAVTAKGEKPRRMARKSFIRLSPRVVCDVKSTSTRIANKFLQANIIAFLLRCGYLVPTDVRRRNLMLCGLRPRDFPEWTDSARCQGRS